MSNTDTAYQSVRNIESFGKMHEIFKITGVPYTLGELVITTAGASKDSQSRFLLIHVVKN